MNPLSIRFSLAGGKLGMSLLLLVVLMVSACGGGGGGGGGATDTTAPAIVATNILPNAVDVPTNTKISFTFNEPIQACATCIRMNPGAYIWTNGSVGVTGTVNVSGSAIEFTPNSILSPNTQYTVYVTTVSDASGNFFFGSSSPQATLTFTTGAALDLTPPTVSSYSQTYVPGGNLVALNSQLSVLFSEAMDPASIDSSTFSVGESNRLNSTVGGMVSYSGATATFVPNALLNANTQYTATVSTGAKDVAGNPMSTAYSWQFTTGASSGNSSHVVTTNPSNGATGVNVNSYITVTFDQSVVQGPNFGFSVSCASGGTTVFNQATHTGSFTPLSPMAGSSACNVTVSGMVDNLGGYIPAYSWSFATAAAPVPVPAPAFSVVSTSPAASSTNVNIGSTMTVNFNGNIGTIPPNAVAVSPAVSGSIFGSGYMSFVFAPQAPLVANTTYTVTVSGVSNTAGALAPTYTWNFTTAPPVPPVVSSTAPANNTAATGASSAIVATFSKSLDAATCTPGSLTVSGGVTGTVTCSGKSISLVPAVPLQLGSSYTATVSAGIKDVDGLSLAGNYTWSFNTLTEYVAPTVVGVSHTQSSVNVEFSELMNAATINAATFSLNPATAGAFSTSGTGVTFTPSAPLAIDTSYTVTISGVKDLAGNTLASSYVWSFMTDPGKVVPVEAYGANCLGVPPLGVYAQNQTAHAQDITICINNAALGYPSCQTFLNIAPNQFTPYSYLSASNSYVGSVNVCYSSGQYTISWVKTGQPITTGTTDTFTSTTYAPTSPVVDPCLVGAIACVPKITAAPVVSTTTSTTSTTYPPSTVSPETSPDADGCYVPQHVPECLVIEKNTLDASNYQVLRLRNNCPQRVYASFCNQRLNGTWDCGADGASSGGSISWWTYGAAGRSIYQYTGSTKWMNDWVCADRDPNMSDNFGK